MSIDISTLMVDFEYIDRALREKDLVREELIKLTREIIRLSSEVVHNVHKGEYDKAEVTLSKAREITIRLSNVLNTHYDLMYSGLIYNALSEYTEAYLFYSIVVERRIPSLSEIGVTIVPYLQGIGDLIGELRRLVIRLLDQLDIEKAEEYLSLMENIYALLRKIDYPEALIPGVKHKIDVASRLIEDTRVLLLSTKNSLRCAQKL